VLVIRFLGSMLVQLLALGVAFRLPAARPHAVASRSACVTMNSYLDSTLEMDATRDDEPDVEPSTMVGSVTPTKNMPTKGTVDEARRKEMMEKYATKPAAPTTAPTPQPTMPEPAYEVAPAPEQNAPLSARAARVLGPLAFAGIGVAATLLGTSVTAPAPITMDEIVSAQKEWGDAIVTISKTYLGGGDYKAAAEKAADELYGYGRTDVLFKPTKAAEDPFRPTGAGALSYFIGGENVDGGFAEDKGFALGPGGIGWKKVVLDNNKIDFNGATATAMGEYYFYPVGGGAAQKVEYTFGYKRNDDGKVRIYLHHSSLPYPGKKKVTAATPLTLDEIVTAQREWGDAIVRISKTYLDGGDVAAAASKAADELYGYGRSDVLFKPTKAAEDPFRPTGEGALSYFIGGDKVEGGFKEDKGFALGPGGVGWKKVIFDNNKIDFNGATAQAMGEYYFYPVGGDPASKVEYTFGYKRNDDGKVRIYLHHSSLPYVPH